MKKCNALLVLLVLIFTACEKTYEDLDYNNTEVITENVVNNQRKSLQTRSQEQLVKLKSKEYYVDLLKSSSGLEANKNKYGLPDWGVAVLINKKDEKAIFVPLVPENGTQAEGVLVAYLDEKDKIKMHDYSRKNLENIKDKNNGNGDIELKSKEMALKIVAVLETRLFGQSEFELDEKFKKMVALNRNIINTRYLDCSYGIVSTTITYWFQINGDGTVRSIGTTESYVWGDVCNWEEGANTGIYTTSNYTMGSSIPGGTGGTPTSLGDQIAQLLENEPFALVDCSHINGWVDIASSPTPNAVITKINNLQSSHGGTLAGDFELQTLDNAGGTVVNLDYFAVEIDQLPINPNTGQSFTAEGFLNHFRNNINDFVEGSPFSPYCAITSICNQETQLWNSSNPEGAIIHIDIPGNDGSVVCTESCDDYWEFKTLRTPIDYDHPVSGTRRFGIKSTSGGKYEIYVKGVDRFTSNLVENALSVISFGSPFFGADNMWEGFQQEMNSFINQNGGNSSIKSPVKDNRPDWNKVDKVLKGIKPVSTLGC